MAGNWSNPGGGPSWAQIASQFKYLPERPLPANLTQIPHTAAQQLAQAGTAAIQQFANAMQQRKMQGIEQELLQQGASPQEAKAYASTGVDPQSAVRAFNAAQARQNQSDDPAMDDLKYRALWDQVNNAENQPAEQTVPVVVNGKSYNVPLTQYLTHIGNKQNSQAASADKVLNKYGMTTDDLSGVDMTTPGNEGGIQYLPKKDASGNEIDYTGMDNDAINKLAVSSQKALANPKEHVAYGGGLDTPIPLNDWAVVSSRLRNQQPIDTTGASGAAGASGLQTQPQATNTQPPEDRVTVQHPDGTVGTIPASQVPQAVSAGYTVVGQ